MNIYTLDLSLLEKEAYSNAETLVGMDTDNKMKRVYSPTIPTKVSELQNDSGFITGYTESDPVYTSEKASLALKTEIPTKVSDLQNDSGFITGYTETDPVYVADKPSIALKTEIPTKVSQLQNDRGYITGYTETDPIYTAEKSSLALKTEIPTKVSELQNDRGYITGYTETDPVYTSEKANLALKTEIPTKVSDLQNDRGYITGYTETDPIYASEKASLALKTEIPTNVSQLNNDANYATTGAVAAKQDILVSGTNIKTINDQSLLGSGNIVISGASGTSNYNDLTNKPLINNVTLSGNKSLSDLGINIPTKVSDLQNDKGFITGYTESDPIYTAEKPSLALKTEIPTKVSDLQNDANFATTGAVAAKQDVLVSGTNIKTINNLSLLGSGNIVISGASGTSNYNDLTNKPLINNVTLSGNKTLADLGVPSKTSDLTNDSSFIAGMVMTEAAYQALATKDPNIIYFTY